MLTRPRRLLPIALVTLAFARMIHAAEVRSPYRQASGATLAEKSARAGEQWLDFDPAALSALSSAPRGLIEVADFPTAPGESGRLVVKQFEVASPEARITVTGKGGETRLPLPAVAHFSGTIAGEPDSHVYLAAYGGELRGWVRSRSGLSYVGPDEGRTGYIVRDSASPGNDRYATAPWTCAEEALPEAPRVPAPAAAAAAFAPALVGFQRGNLIVETDEELLAKFSGDVSAMSAYVLTLFGAFNLIYERDLSFHLTVVEVHAWTTADPWNGPTPVDQLLQIGDWYHANRPPATFPRATVHLLSGIAVQGGVAYRSALCIGDFDRGDTHWGGAYGISQVFGDYPAEAWDLYVATHEIGHNAGSKHTHCYVPEIDQCYSGESGCYAGATSLPPGGGTIMSYCHTLPGGLDNINLVFHARCITEQLLPYIQGANCKSAVATFPDVPTTSPFFHYVETIYQLGITGGCAGGNYCPGNPVTRAQMAVFLLKAKFGSSHVPPVCTGVFADVTCTPGSGFGDWIEELASLGITSGCGGNNYCPNNTVTRKQMAPFLLKTLYGSSYVPPQCTGIFTDVTCTPGSGFGDWIERLYALSITGGCVASPLQYCPNNPNTRAQMAVFLTKTFSLTW